MFLLNNIFISSEILTARFVCNISQCKGMCCCEGECGAPIEYDEIEILQSTFNETLPYLRKEAINKIKAEGLWKRNIWGGYEISLCDDACCIYACEKNQTVVCAIERAWKDGKIGFRKPISCHLYPIRVRKFGIFEGLVYEHWDICQFYNDEKAPLLFEFVSEALERKYGRGFVEKLRKMAQKLTDKRCK